MSFDMLWSPDWALILDATELLNRLIMLSNLIRKQTCYGRRSGVLRISLQKLLSHLAYRGVYSIHALEQMLNEKSWGVIPNVFDQ